MKKQWLYVLADASKTDNGELHAEVHQVLRQLLTCKLDHPLREIKLVLMDASASPVMTPLGDFKLSEAEACDTPGLHLGGVLRAVADDIRRQADLEEAYIMIVLKERSYSPIVRWVCELERMEKVIKPMLVVKCGDRVSFHQMHFASSLWISHNQKNLVDEIKGWIGEPPYGYVRVNGITFYPHVDPDRTLQSYLNELPPGKVVKLFPLEYEGPIYLNKPIEIDGQGATIWGKKGPLVIVQSDGVQLTNLRIELTGRTKTSCVMDVRASIPRMEQVVVQGAVSGISDEEGVWRYPVTVDFNSISSYRSHRKQLKIHAPTKARVISNISGLRLIPDTVNQGDNHIEIVLEPLPPETLISGTISIMTDSVMRNIYVRGSVGAAPSSLTTADPAGNSRRRRASTEQVTFEWTERE